MAELITPTTQLIPETALIAQLGIPVKKMRAMRPTGTEKRPDGVYWPRAAAAALATSVGATLGNTEKMGAAASDDTEELTVVSTSKGPDGRHFSNPNVILALRKNQEKVYVRVTHSKKYRPTLRNATGEPLNRPMVIKGRPSSVGNWWILVGREPRYPAQW